MASQSSVDGEICEFRASDAHNKWRLDHFLGTHIPDLSRSRLQAAIADGRVSLGNETIRDANKRVKPGEVYTICIPPPRTAEPEPQAIPLNVLYEDAELIVIDKQAGLVVHPAAGNLDGTLVNALLAHCGPSLKGIGGVARPGIVHRLDKDTSGCLVVAKNDAAHLALSAQFAARKVEKVYHAIVCGKLAKNEGAINASIARHAVQRKKMSVVTRGGREALTTYRVLEPLAGAMLVEARIHTGRTHQIRVHFQHLGHPLVGDVTYGPRPNQRLAESVHCKASRQMLHARRLVFVHPRTTKPIAVEAPWPEDFEETLQALRR